MGGVSRLVVSILQINNYSVINVSVFLIPVGWFILQYRGPSCSGGREDQSETDPNIPYIQ